MFRKLVSFDPMATALDFSRLFWSRWQYSFRGIMNELTALSISKVAARLSICEKTVRRMINDGSLKAYRVGAIWRILEADLQDYLSRRTNQDTREAA